MSDEPEPAEIVRTITVKEMRPAYRAFRAQLARATKINEAVFLAWADIHHQEIVNGYLTSLGETGDVKHFNYDEMMAFARERYAQLIRKAK